jgi:hypothetical protein
MFPRNDPCPCGSGRKYKRCCDGTVSINAAAVFRAERRTPGYIAGVISAIDATVAPLIPQPTTHGATQP